MKLKITKLRCTKASIKKAVNIIRCTSTFDKENQNITRKKMSSKRYTAFIIAVTLVTR